MNFVEIIFLSKERKNSTLHTKTSFFPIIIFQIFVIFEKVILEIKAIQELSNSEIKQTLNYLAASKNKIGLLVNFGEDSLKYKRIIL
ncbi:GxxExxY protein [Flavobacterium sp. RSP29]|uniref:GxxExxY protein n=1 Tax=Flavobacterium sp. RSP29 TaxID=3401731 RepID=UPI003AAEA612